MVSQIYVKVAPNRPVFRNSKLSWGAHKCALFLFAILSFAFSDSVLAQALAPKQWVPYTGWVNARKPPQSSIGASIPNTPTGRPGSLPAYYDVFYLAMLRTESDTGHYIKGFPRPGWSDPSFPSIISIGASQARYDTGTPPEQFTIAKRYNPYLKSQSWDLRRYLWDPGYNAAIGFGYYTMILTSANGNNNPCLAYAGYNGGPGNPSATKGLTAYIKNKYRSPKAITTHVASFVKNARLLAGPHKAEIEKVLQTSPGCNVGMDDVNPLPPMASPPEGGGESQVHVLGYCDPKAIDMLTNHYRAQQRDLDDTLEPLYRAVKRPYAGTNGGAGSSGTGSGTGGTGTGTGGSSGSGVFSDSMDSISSCVSLSWPNLSFQGPTMDQLIKAAEKQIVKLACEKARATVADAKSKLNQQFYFNPRIPGVPSSGVTISTDGPP